MLCHANHPGMPVIQPLNEAFVFQLFERISHRHSRNAQHIRQLYLIEFLAILHTAQQNFLPNDVGNLLSTCTSVHAFNPILNNVSIIHLRIIPCCYSNSNRASGNSYILCGIMVESHIQSESTAARI